MGLEDYSNLYAGVRMDEVYKEDYSEKEVTKYDEDTGMPYKKTLADPVHILGTKKFTQDEWNEFLEEHYNPGGELELFAIAAAGPPDILGVKIAENPFNRYGKNQLVEVTQAMIDAGVVKAKKELAKFGIEDVKLFMGPRFSYWQSKH